MTKIKTITIVGGGTSGWLTAAYLIKNLQEPVHITLIESSKIGVIGVGEGTQPYTSTFLRKCGFEPHQWMKPADATYKYGVEFIGWTDRNYFVDNDSTRTHIVNKDNLLHHAWVGKDVSEYLGWLPAYRLAKNNISPKLDDKLDFVVGNSATPAEAVHFNAIKIGESIKALILDKIEYHDAEVIGVNTDQYGVSSLSLSNGILNYSSDIYIDCTGFKSLLIEGALKQQHISINNLLPCDSAVAMPTQYINPEKECHPYTKATAMDCGWRWTIPTYSRIGNGYVYSSKYISSNDAEAELRKSINEYEAKAIHLKMRCGFKSSIAVGNVLAVGLSAGFVEPLEATGITFTTKVVETFCNLLNNFENNYDTNTKLTINRFFITMVEEIVNFIFLHYKNSTKRDTSFWQDIDKIPVNNKIKELESMFKPYPPSKLTQYGLFDMFHSGQWFQVLSSDGYYSKIQNSLTEQEEIYYKIHTEMLKLRTDLQIEHYPNHYNYLKKTYEI